MRLLFDYCTDSARNVCIILLVGAVFFIFSRALDNSQSNGFELCVSGLGRIAGFILLLVSLTTLVFAGREYTTKEFGNYRNLCRQSAVKRLGGKENIVFVKKEMENLDSTGIDITDIDKTSKAVETMVVKLNEEEIALLTEVNIHDTK